MDNEQIDLEDAIREKKITEDFLSVMDSHYFITDNFNHRSTGNGLFYTGVALPLINSYEIRVKILTSAYACLSPTGLYRVPSGHWRKQYQAPDDYFGLGVISDELDPRLAEQILIKARKQYWMLNERGSEWRWKSWMGRMPHLQAHLQMAAGETPDVWRMVIWGLALFASLFKKRKSQDSFRKGIAMCQVAMNRTKFIDGLISIWVFVFLWRFPGGLGQLELEYGWPKEHATIKHGWGYAPLIKERK